MKEKNPKWSTEREARSVALEMEKEHTQMHVREDQMQ